MADTFDPIIATKVLELLVDGKTMTAIEKMDGMPSRTTIWRWVRAQPDFRRAYDRARDESADSFAEAVIDTVQSEKDAQLARVKADAYKWMAEKRRPREYGQRLDLSVTQKFDANELHGRALQRLRLMRSGGHTLEDLRAAYEGKPAGRIIDVLPESIDIFN